MATAVEHGLVADHQLAQWRQLAVATEVVHHCVGRVTGGPAEIGGAQAEVGLLGIQEERLVPAAEGLVATTVDQHRRAARPVHRASHRVASGIDDQFAEDGNATGPLTAQHRLAERPQDGGRAALTVRRRPVGLDEAGHRDAGARNGERGDKRLDAARTDAGVGVQHEQVVARRGMAGTEVDAGCVAAVTAASHERDGRSVGDHEIDRLIARSVVDDNDWYVRCMHGEGVEATADHRGAVIRDDDRGHPAHRALRIGWLSSGRVRVRPVASRSSSSTTKVRINRPAPGSG